MISYHWLDPRSISPIVLGSAKVVFSFHERELGQVSQSLLNASLGYWKGPDAAAKKAEWLLQFTFLIASQSLKYINIDIDINIEKVKMTRLHRYPGDIVAGGQ